MPARISIRLCTAAVVLVTAAWLPPAAAPRVGVWEYTPIQLFQTRAGMRFYNGVPGDALSNRDELFVEMHVYF